MQHAFRVQSNSIEVQADLAALPANASVHYQSENRYGSFRAYQVDEIWEIDDALVARQAPTAGAWYIRRIYWGRMYETVFSAPSSTFHAGVRSQLLSSGPLTALGLNGSINAWARRNRLEFSVNARGLSPVSEEALFAQGEQEVQSRYRATGDLAPIFVDYRSLTAEPPVQRPYEFVPPISSEIVLTELSVISNHPWYWPFGNRPLRLGISCSLNDVASMSGEESIWVGEVTDTWGSSGRRYPLSWRKNFDLAQGDRLRCTVSGQLEDIRLNPVMIVFDVRRQAAAPQAVEMRQGFLTIRINYSLSGR